MVKKASHAANAFYKNTYGIILSKFSLQLNLSLDQKINKIKKDIAVSI